MITQLLQVLTS